MRSAATILVLIALAGTANAHVSNFGDTKTIQAGPYLITVNPSLSPVYTNTLLSLQVDVSNQSGMYVQRPVNLTLIEPDGTTRELKIARSPNGGQEAPTVLQQKGNYTLIGRVTDENGTYEGRVWLDVYPNLPVRIFPLNEEQDVAPGQLTTFGVQVVDRNAEPFADVTDLGGSIELWNTDHTQMMRRDFVEFRKSGSDGTWTVQYTFPETGMYHVRFASESGNFTEDDVPLLHTYATPAPPPIVSAQTPLPGGLALLALALIALGRSR